MEEIRGGQYDEERAFFQKDGCRLVHCLFEGAADGESALKQCRRIEAEDCRFHLRYPLWHGSGLVLKHCEFSAASRAALWYSRQIVIQDCTLSGIKALRECDEVRIQNCQIDSAEFGWQCSRVHLADSHLVSEYLFLHSRDLWLNNVEFQGKYSFQYCHNVRIENSVLDTKDAFWHAENVLVRNCVVKGEYLAWYSRNVTFENCTILGTQPFCHCTGLRLIHCRMVDTDLAFESADVQAVLTAPIRSILNPRSGWISVPSVQELIFTDPRAQAQVLSGAE